MKLKKFTLSGAACAAMLMASSSMLPAHASSTKHMNFDEIVADAEVCVAAEAVSINFVETASGVQTLTTFSVQDVAFGPAGSTITVRTDGGDFVRNGIALSEVVAGSPRFMAGQSALLFLDKSQTTDDYAIVGSSQGAFAIGQNDSVQLPQTEGGLMDIEAALTVVREQRASGVGGDVR